jgi:GNAT superfamily N-acetyltransferase
MGAGVAPRIELLGKHHERASFSCGSDDLDRYLRARARQDRDRKVAAVFVLVGDEPDRVAGFYTLSALALAVAELPPETVRKLPRYPLIPARLIGRLAVDRRYQGRGHGDFLLMDALRRILDHSTEIASFAAVVEAKSDAARGFYGAYGFIPFPDHSDRLFLSVATIERMFE